MPFTDDKMIEYQIMIECLIMIECPIITHIVSLELSPEENVRMR